MPYGSKLLAAGLGVACFFGGLWWGHGELDGLLATPPGGLYLEPRTRTVWSVFPDNPQLLHYSRIPTPEQARMSKLFPTIIRQDAEGGAPGTTTTRPSAETTTTTQREPQPQVWVMPGTGHPTKK